MVVFREEIMCCCISIMDDGGATNRASFGGNRE
jgi:hypothetical protein